MTEICYGGTLENIKDKIEKYTLEDFSYVSENPGWLGKAKDKYKGCGQILGNFEEYSNAFSIITDDKNLIDEFKTLFAKNRAKNRG